MSIINGFEPYNSVHESYCRMSVDIVGQCILSYYTMVLAGTMADSYKAQEIIICLN